jgi:hypothetical protein
MFLKVTVVNFVVPGVIFDFASFSFHVPICGSAAKHAAHPKKQNVTVNPIVFVFMTAIESGFLFLVNIFPGATLPNVRLWPSPQRMIFGHDRRTHPENQISS